MRSHGTNIASRLLGLARAWLVLVLGLPWLGACGAGEPFTVVGPGAWGEGSSEPPELGVVTASAASSPLGTLASTFAVNEQGAATYEIPIEVPPGLKGVEPSLRLSYSNGSGDGLLGMGWVLNGLSAISRCPSTFLQDNALRGIQYDDLDRFCLDGRRLIAISGTYGADGTHYRTEIESWSRIVSWGRCGNGPCSFTVESKNGEEVEFGATTDSRVLASGKPTVRVWAVNKVRDLNGNHLTVSYSQQEGQYYPQDIHYTMNPANLQLKRRRVSFLYEPRPDPILSYTAGSLVRTSLRLQLIRTFIASERGERFVRDYRLGYTQPLHAGASRRSLLTRIEGCDAAGVCLPATQLTWYQVAMDGFTQTTSPSDYQDVLRSDPGVNIIPGDYNGDGKMDFLRQEKGFFDDDCINTFNVYLSRGDGLFDIVTPTANNEQCDLKGDETNVIPGDYNGDGKTDFLRQEKGSWDDDCTNTFNVFFSRGDGTFDKVTPDNNGEQCDLKSDDGALIIPGDYNGDGKTDFLRQERGSWDGDCINTFNVFFSRGDGTFDKLTPDSNGEQCQMKFDDGAYVIPGDYNGDGKTDFLRQEKGSWDDDLINSFSIFFARGTREPDLVSSIQNGLGGRTELSYGPLTDPGLYVKGSGAGAGTQDFQGPIYVLSAYREAGRRVTPGLHRFSYSGARANLLGRGWLGFASVTHINEAAGTTRITTYHQGFPLTGAVKSVSLRDVTGVQMSTSYEYDTSVSAGVYQVRKAAERLSHTENGLTYSTRTEYVYDGLGNLALTRELGREADISDDLSTCTTYLNDTMGWNLNLPTETLSASACSLVGGNCTCTGILERELREYTTDGRANVVAVSRWVDTSATWLTTRYIYDALGNVTESTAPSGAIERTTYDPDFQTFPVQVVQTDGAGISLLQRSTYAAAFGTLLTRTDANNQTWTQTADGFGRVVAAATPSPSGASVTVQTASWGVDAAGDVYQETLRRTDWSLADWHWERQTLDGQGRLWRRTARGPDAARPITQTYTYDGAGRSTAESLPFLEGQTTTSRDTKYDAWGRITQVTDPSGSVTRLQYAVDTSCPGCVRRVSITEAFGTNSARTWTQVVDTHERILRQTDPEGRLAAFEYDRLGRLLTVTGPLGSSSYTYDTLGRRKSFTTSNTGTTSYAYDSAGFLAASADARGQRIDYRYDKLGRPLTKTVLGVETVRFTHDSAANANGRGRLTGVSITLAGQTEASSSWSFAYSAEGLRQTNSLTTGGLTYVHHQTYDPLGRQRDLTYPDGSVLSHTYNPAGFLEQLAMGTTVHARYTAHDASGLPLKFQYGNGTLMAHGYDGGRRLVTSRTTTANGSLLLDYGYTWDALQHLTQITDRRDASRSQSFSYSAQGYLKQALGIYGTQTFAYDAAGNLVTKQGVTYTYQNHRVTSGTDGFSATYDASGNRITQSRGGVAWAYQYDGDNQLKEVRRDGAVVNRFTYDSEGQRLTKVDANGTTTLYVSPVYEVVTFLDGRRVSTRYIDGPSGRVAALTVAMASAAAMGVDPAGLDVEANLFERGTSQGLLKLAENRLNRWAHTPLDLSALSRALSVLVGLGATLLLLRQTRAGRRLAGVLARRLAGVGVLTPQQAEAWGRMLPTDISRRHPWLVRLVPGVLAAVTLTACEQTWPESLRTRQDAALSSGANGQGHPVEGTVYFHQNHLGSTSVVTDASGNEVSRVEYLPFGEMYAPATSGPDIFRPKYTGQEADTDSGLYYYNSRYYDPVTARFMTADSNTQGGPAHTIVSLNRYAYAMNDPMRYTDPSGHIAWMILIGVLVGAFMGAATVNDSYNPLNWAWGSWKTWAGIGVGGLLGGVASGVSMMARSAITAGLASGLINGLATASLKALSPEGTTVKTFFQDIAISMAKGTVLAKASRIAVGAWSGVTRVARAAWPTVTRQAGAAWTAVTRLGGGVLEGVAMQRPVLGLPPVYPVLPPLFLGLPAR